MKNPESNQQKKQQFRSKIISNHEQKKNMAPLPLASGRTPGPDRRHKPGEFVMYCISNIIEVLMCNIESIVNESAKNYHETQASPGKTEEKQFIRPVVAAQILSVTTETLRHYEQLGHLHAYHLPSGHLRYLKSEVLGLVPVKVS